VPKSDNEHHNRCFKYLKEGIVSSDWRVGSPKQTRDAEPNIRGTQETT
jgi:hypothetical protein